MVNHPTFGWWTVAATIRPDLRPGVHINYAETGAADAGRPAEVEGLSGELAVPGGNRRVGRIPKSGRNVGMRSPRAGRTMFSVCQQTHHPDVVRHNRHNHWGMKSGNYLDSALLTISGRLYRHR